MCMVRGKIFVCTVLLEKPVFRVSEQFRQKKRALQWLETQSIYVITAQLIYTFVFAFANARSSHDAAEIY